MEEPDGNMEPIVVHGPLIEDALAYEISLPVENRKYRLSDVLWTNDGSWTLQAPEQLPGFAYPRTKAVKSAIGVASFCTTILNRVSPNIGSGVDELLHVPGNGFYTVVTMNILR
jgi:hypothetical protein